MIKKIIDKVSTYKILIPTIAGLIILILIYNITLNANFISMEVMSPEQDDIYQLYYNRGIGFNEEDSIRYNIKADKGIININFFGLPSGKINGIRIDPGWHKDTVIIKSITFKHRFHRLNINIPLLQLNSGEILKYFHPLNDISTFNEKDGYLYCIISGYDPYFVSIDQLQYIHKEITKKIIIIKIYLSIFCLIILSFLLLTIRKNIIKHISPYALINNYILIVILCILPAFTGFLYVYFFGVNVPFWDQWEFIPLFEKINSWTLNFQDLFSQHNEHRIFFPRIIMLIIACVTKYNTKWEMYFTEILLCINLIICFLVIKKEVNINIKSIPYCFLPVPYLIFTLRQHENMLWGFQIGFVIVLTMSLITFYFILRLVEREHIKNRYLYMFSSLTAAVIASFSSIMGLFVWPTVILQILISQINRRNKIYYSLIWTATGITVWIIYFINYHKPGHHPDIFIFLHNPYVFLRYFFTCIGTTLFWSKETAFIGGSIIFFIFLITLLYLYKNKRLEHNTFWVGAMVFSFLTILSISAGRCGFGIEQAMTSRYVTFSIFIVISLYAILIDVTMREKQIFIKSLFFLLVFMILLSIPYSYKLGWETGNKEKHNREYLAFILATIDSQPEENIKKIYAGTKEVKERAIILKKMKWSVFSN